MPRAGRSRKGRSLSRPALQPAPIWAWVLATWFGSGRSPVIPGTAGTAATLPLCWALGSALPAPWAWAWTPWPLLAAIVLFYPAVLAATKLELSLGRHDPGMVVIDEVLGTLLTMAFLPAAAFGHWQVYVAAFFIFRLLDIWKPGIIDHSQALPRGWGVVVDDVLAGLFGGIGLGLVAHWAPAWLGL